MMTESAPYKEAFPKGSRVCVAGRAFLEQFMAEWIFHHKLQAEQLAYAGREATVHGVGFYHGGDAVYVLDEIPGTWLEPCLRHAGERRG